MALEVKGACEAILAGYRQSLHEEGCPIVLAEEQAQIQKLGFDQIKSPPPFWDKLNSLPAANHGLPRSAMDALRETMPAADLRYKVVRREAGLATLVEQRFVAVAKRMGG